jgi:peptide/nickel transport system substrate-binding protein
VNEGSEFTGRGGPCSRRAVLRYVGSITLGAVGVSVGACSSPAPASTGTAAPATSALARSVPTSAAGSATSAAPTSSSASSAAAATSAPAATAAGPSGTLRYATADFANESMDPINLESPWGWAMYDSLLTFDAQGNVVANVAEKYSLSPDGLTWTFNIRKGINFHNGDPLTANDVVFSLHRFGSKASTNPWSPYILKNNESITAQDNYTVVFQALKPE